jgi:heme oxygenase
LIPETRSEVTNLRTLLRIATAEDHARLDARAAQLDLGHSDGYIAFLCWHARVLPKLEAQLGINPELPDWPDRIRTPALLADLAVLRIAPPAPLPPPSLVSRAERIGALYVLEGSRLGATMLARRVGLAQPLAPRSFLTHGADARLWPRFLAWLEVLHVAESAIPGMVAGARATFAAYLQTLSD